MSASSIPNLTFDSGLPANVDAERTVLGAVLLDDHALIEIEDKIESEDLSLDSHRRILLRMMELRREGSTVDIVTLANRLAKHKEIEMVGGVAFLASLTEGLPRRPVITEYLAILKDKSILRKLMLICSNGIARAADQGEAALEIGLAVSSQVQDAITAGLGSTMERAGEYLDRAYPTAVSMTEKTAKSQGIETGFREFDRMTCGLQKGELVIIAARPSMGKSALAACILEHVAVNCESPTAFFSLEMNKESFLRRMICSRARVPLQDHKDGRMTASERMMDEFAESYDDIHKAPLYIDDKPKTALKLAAAARAQKAKTGLDLIMVDYLGLFQHEDTGRRRNQYQEVGVDALLMKYLAQELGVPVVLLCQLSREVMKRTDKRPVLSDLRDSGNLEEHADVVSFIHREGYYEPKDDTLRNKAEWIISKQRSGPVGICSINWDGSITRFSDIIDPNDYQEGFNYWGDRV
jgi:replicative DNA helicase